MLVGGASKYVIAVATASRSSVTAISHAHLPGRPTTGGDPHTLGHVHDVGTAAVSLPYREGEEQHEVLLYSAPLADGTTIGLLSADPFLATTPLQTKPTPTHAWWGAVALHYRTHTRELAVPAKQQRGRGHVAVGSKCGAHMLLTHCSLTLQA